jgi:Mannosyltransferase (PIG-V)
MTQPLSEAEVPEEVEPAVGGTGLVDRVRSSVREEDRTALGVWLCTRIGIALLSVTAAASLSSTGSWGSFLGRWTQWDVARFIELAQYGYGGNPAKPHDPGWPAFFPGFPLVLRAVHVVIPDWRLAALLIAFVAGAFAMMALARLGEFESPGSGAMAVAALVLSPAAVFLFAGYSETLFLAFAMPAWLLARKGRWELAVVCAALSTTVRITGLFLGIALIVEFLVGSQGIRVPGGWRRLPWLIVPFLPLAAYFTYQWHRTGDWMAWQHAQEAGWQRYTVWPWKSFMTTWRAAFGPGYQFTWAFRMELAAAVVMVAVTLWLLWRRRWSEFVYVGLQTAALMTSSYYLSIGRTTLLLWPLWIGLGTLGVRRPRFYFACFAIMIPLLATEVVTFTSGAWAG